MHEIEQGRIGNRDIAAAQNGIVGLRRQREFVVGPAVGAVAFAAVPAMFEIDEKTLAARLRGAGSGGSAA